MLESGKTLVEVIETIRTNTTSDASIRQSTSEEYSWAALVLLKGLAYLMKSRESYLQEYFKAITARSGEFAMDAMLLASCHETQREISELSPFLSELEKIIRQIKKRSGLLPEDEAGWEWFPFELEQFLPLRYDGDSMPQEISKNREFEKLISIFKIFQQELSTSECANTFSRKKKSGNAENLPSGTAQEKNSQQQNVAEAKKKTAAPVSNEEPEIPIIEIPIKNIKIGMVLAENLLTTTDHMLIVPRGRKIDKQSLDLLLSFSERGLMPEKALIQGAVESSEAEPAKA